MVKLSRASSDAVSKPTYSSASAIDRCRDTLFTWYSFGGASTANAPPVATGAVLREAATGDATGASVGSAGVRDAVRCRFAGGSSSAEGDDRFLGDSELIVSLDGVVRCAGRRRGRRRIR